MKGRKTLGSMTWRRSTSTAKAAAGRAIAEIYRRDGDCERIIAIPSEAKVYYTGSGMPPPGVPCGTESFLLAAASSIACESRAIDLDSRGLRTREPPAGARCLRACRLSSEPGDKSAGQTSAPPRTRAQNPE